MEGQKIYDSQDEIERKLIVNSCDFHKVVSKLRDFFVKRFCRSSYSESFKYFSHL